MKILVPIARILNPDAKPSVDQDGISLLAPGFMPVMNPFDEVALTAAVTFKQASKASEVIAIGVGSEGYQDTLRSALAMQADRAIWIKTEDMPSLNEIVASIAFFARQEKVDLLLCGKQSADDDACCVPQMLSGLLDYPQIVSATTLDIADHQVIATADYKKALATMTVTLPCVVGVDLLLCSPKFPSLGQILKSKKTPIEEHVLADCLNVPLPAVSLIKREMVNDSTHCHYLDSVEELFDIIKQ